MPGLNRKGVGPVGRVDIGDVEAEALLCVLAGLSLLANSGKDLLGLRLGRLLQLLVVILHLLDHRVLGFLHILHMVPSGLVRQHRDRQR